MINFDRWLTSLWCCLVNTSEISRWVKYCPEIAQMLIMFSWGKKNRIENDFPLDELDTFRYAVDHGFMLTRQGRERWELLEERELYPVPYTGPIQRTGPLQAEVHLDLGFVYAPYVPLRWQSPLDGETE